MKQFTTRTRHRKRAIDILFEAQQRGFGDDRESILGLLAKRQVVTAAQSPLPEYAITLVEGVAAHLTDIDSLIATYARDWDLDRLAGTDLAAMRVAVWEILYAPEIDPRVAIDQAVTIVAAIGTDRSPSFVNAVLDRIREVVAVGGNAPAAQASDWEQYRVAQVGGYGDDSPFGEDTAEAADSDTGGADDSVDSASAAPAGGEPSDDEPSGDEPSGDDLVGEQPDGSQPDGSQPDGHKPAAQEPQWRQLDQAILDEMNDDY